MAQLLRLTTATIMLCAIAILAIKIFGNAQPNPLADWFTRVDGSRCTTPCLFGIQPGVTKYDDAVKIIALHPATRSMQTGQTTIADDNNHIGFGNDAFCIKFWRNEDNQVGGIIVSTTECSLTPIRVPQDLLLGQLIAVLGNPNSVALGAPGVAPDYYFFLNGKLYFQAWNNENACALKPNMSYELLTLDVSDSRDLSFPQWVGFARRIRYAQSADDAKYLSACSR